MLDRWKLNLLLFYSLASLHKPIRSLILRIPGDGILIPLRTKVLIDLLRLLCRKSRWRLVHADLRLNLEGRVLVEIRILFMVLNLAFYGGYLNTTLILSVCAALNSGHTILFTVGRC